METRPFAKVIRKFPVVPGKEEDSWEHMWKEEECGIISSYTQGSLLSQRIEIASEF